MVQYFAVAPTNLLPQVAPTGRNCESCTCRLLCYLAAMTKLEDIEKAIAKLAPEELARFRAWFEEFDAARFDEKIERDAKAGRLDRLAEPTIASRRSAK